jgi:hypothetical protein
MPGGYQLEQGLCNGNDNGTDTVNSRGTAVAGANGAYGSYVQIVASTGSDTCAILVSLSYNGGANTQFQSAIRIGVGAGGSEVVIINDMLVYAASSSYVAANYFFPICIPSGTRIAAACYCPGGTDTVYVSVVLFDGSFASIEGYAGVDSIGLSAAKGTTITCGAANTKGSYAQLTASTSRDYMGFIISIDGLNAGLAQTGSDILVDLAIGAGGSEVNIVPNFTVPIAGTASGMQGIVPSDIFPINIPSGTRIAARAQSATASRILGLTVYGIYK